MTNHDKRYVIISTVYGDHPYRCIAAQAGSLENKSPGDLLDTTSGSWIDRGHRCGQQVIAIGTRYGHTLLYD